MEGLLGKFHHVSPIIGMETPFHYRNKVQAAFGLDQNRRIISGVYQSSTHHIVSIDKCMTEDKKADEIIVTIRGLLAACKLTPYDERRGVGFLRHVLVKRGFQSGQIMVVLVTATPIFPQKKHFLEGLLKAHPEITTVLMNINNRFTSMVLGDDERVLYGSGTIDETLCGCIFRISAKSFYQINPVQTEVLYEKAIEMAELTGSETVIDAYCGVGTIGLIAAKSAGRVLGIESNEDAVRDAKFNTRRNNIKNMEFRQADAGIMLCAMAEEHAQVDVVLMDPPRAGSDKRFLSALLQLAPKRIVYISCNPKTQARDLEMLIRGDGSGVSYRVHAIQPVDMFPHTNHVEVCVALYRK